MTTTLAEPTILGDGAPVLIRPLEPSDADAVQAVFDGLGCESRINRYLVPKASLSESDLRMLTSIDHVDHEAMVAFSVGDAKPIGIARIVRLHEDRDTAELAVDVVDEWQHQGVGSALTQALLQRAHELHLDRISVLIAPYNRGAAGLLRHLPGTVTTLSRDSSGNAYVVALADVSHGGTD